MSKEEAGVFEGVSEVFLPVRDLERSLRWYTSTFGMRATFRDAERRAAGLSAPNGTHLNLVESRDYHPILFPHNDFSVRSAFTLLADAPDVEVARRHLLDAGAHVQEASAGRADDPDSACFDFLDLDGNPISVVWHGRR